MECGILPFLIRLYHLNHVVIMFIQKVNDSRGQIVSPGLIVGPFISFSGPRGVY